MDEQGALSWRMDAKWIHEHMCWTCRYSADIGGWRLKCSRSTQAISGEACHSYEREPGADMPTEPERKRQDFGLFSHKARANMIASGFNPDA